MYQYQLIYIFSEEHDVVDVDLSKVKIPSLKNAEVGQFQFIGFKFTVGLEK
jgi:hypothetical protein